MKKSKRYQLTEGQLKSVIQFIPENYPPGVTDHNIDQLSGANSGSYLYIDDVEYDTRTGDLIFDVVTDNGKDVQKNLWTGDDNFIKTIESELPKHGYDLDRNEEWDIADVSINNHHVIFTITDYHGKAFPIPIHSSTIVDWLPEMDEADMYDEPPEDW